MTATANKLEGPRGVLPAEVIRERDGRVIASPRSVEEVAAVTRYADEHGLTIEIVGAGTKRGWGNPVDANVELETAGLAGVREHSWQDLTATVGAGTTWAAMQRELARHRQFVALDPLWPETATVGGIIATNDSGALRLRYGSLRDLIIGMTIVLADGTVAKSGGKVVKNVAGYDLHKLMTGAYGTLGVIAEVTFRLHPVQEEKRSWTLLSKRAETLGEVLMQVLDSQLSPQAMQLRTRVDRFFALDIELAGLPEAMGSQMAALNQIARGVGVLGGDAVNTSPGAFAVRQWLFDTPGGVVCKITMLPSATAQVSAEVVRLGGMAVAQATGILFARFDNVAAEASLPSLYRFVDAAGDGSITILRAPERPLPAWAVTPAGEMKGSVLMHDIKRQFDAKRTLNPGRFVGGI